MLRGEGNDLWNELSEEWIEDFDGLDNSRIDFGQDATASPEQLNQSIRNASNFHANQSDSVRVNDSVIIRSEDNVKTRDGLPIRRPGKFAWKQPDALQDLFSPNKLERLFEQPAPDPLVQQTTSNDHEQSKESRSQSFLFTGQDKSMSDLEQSFGLSHDHLFNVEHDTITRGRLSELILEIGKDSDDTAHNSLDFRVMQSRISNPSRDADPVSIEKSNTEPSRPKSSNVFEWPRASQSVSSSAAEPTGSRMPHQIEYPDHIDFLDDLEEQVVASLDETKRGHISNEATDALAHQWGEFREFESYLEGDSIIQELTAGNPHLQENPQIAIASNNDSGISGSDSGQSNRESISSLMDLSDRNLVTLPSLSSRFHSRLTRVRLNSNRLSQLTGLPDTIVHLQVSNNVISNLTSFSHLKNVQVLDISRNQLTDVSALSCLQSLRECDLTENQIFDLSGIMFLPHLSVLDASKNQLSCVDFTYSNLIRLQVLRLNNSNVTQIVALHKLNALEELYVDSNDLTSFKFERNLKRLHHLSAKDNNITSFSADKVPRLERLHLERNELHMVDTKMATGLKSLSLAYQMTDGQIRLDMANREVSQLEELVISGNPGVQICDFSHSHLEVLEACDCHLSRLPFSCLQNKSIRSLDLSNNQLHDIGDLRHLTRLGTLNLEENKISDISMVLRVIRPLERLTELNLSSNPITCDLYDDATRFDMSQREDSVRDVRRICYRSAILLSGSSTMQILDSVCITDLERKRAKSRIKTMKKFMRREGIQPSTSTHSPETRQRAPTQSASSKRESTRNLSAMNMDETIEEFRNWKPDAMTLDDVPVNEHVMIHI